MASSDALDHRAGGKPRFSKAQRRAYARKKAMDDLLLPPKNPIPPLVLVKRPPTPMKKADEEE